MVFRRPASHNPAEPPPRRPGRPSRHEVYARLDTQIGELWHNLGGLPRRLEADGIWRGIWLEEAHHSTAIEGNTLVLKQVEVLLGEGRAVGDKELREYMEVRGYANAADWVYGRAIDPGEWSGEERISVTEVRHVHRLAMEPVWDVAPHPDAGPDEGPGAYRRHDIQPFPAGMTPPPWTDVAAEMTEWITEANSLQPTAADFPEAVARAHCRFEQIHPFLDGNGRTGRLVLNLLLVRLGYPPAIVYKNQRARYLDALRRGDLGDPGALGELIARAILDNLYKFVIPSVAGPARLVPLGALADARVTASALRNAANRGRLQATRGADGHWRSSRNWVEDYLGTRYVRVRA
ncbi:MAG: Fic family protein [Chloroflexota bacterium]|nr:Fic family protein [Chloroflexota bacterium]